MHPQDIAITRQRYLERLQQYGYSPQTLGWGKEGRQSIRFGVLCEQLLLNPHSSVLDVGCGFADLYDFLRAAGWRGSYTGLDMLPELVTMAAQRHPDIDLRIGEINDFSSTDRFDFVIASGIFNAKLHHGDNLQFIAACLKKMFSLCAVQTAVDFMSSRVDFMHPVAWHTEPEWALAQGLHLSKNVQLRHDYMPYEFALFINKDAQMAPNRVFVKHLQNRQS